MNRHNLHNGESEKLNWKPKKANRLMSTVAKVQLNIYTCNILFVKINLQHSV